MDLGVVGVLILSLVRVNLILIWYIDSSYSSHWQVHNKYIYMYMRISEN